MKDFYNKHRLLFTVVIVLLINVISDYFNGKLTLISFIGMAVILTVMYVSWPKDSKPDNS